MAGAAARRQMSGHGKSDRVLVCLPTYHSKIEWLKRSVASLMEQTHSNFDCMIVKDGCRTAC